MNLNLFLLLKISIFLQILVVKVNNWCFVHSFSAKSNSEIYDVDFHPTGVYLLYSDTSKDVVIKHAVNLNTISTYNSPTNKDPFTARFSPNGLYIAVGYNQNLVSILKGIPPFNQITRFNAGHGQTFQVHFSSDSTKLVTCGKDFKAKIWWVANWTKQYQIPQSDQVYSCKFDNAKNVILGMKNNRLVKYNAGTTNSPPINSNEGTPIWCVDNGNNDNKIISGTGNGKGQVSPASPYSSTQIFSGQQQVNGCAFSQTDDYFAFAAKAKRVKIVRVSDNSVTTFNQPFDEARCIRFSYDGNYLISGDKSGTVYYYYKNCNFCQPGFFLNSTTQCQSCITRIKGCGICRDATNCHQCVQGYYLNTITFTCQYCKFMQGCFACSNQTNCTQCQPGYYLNSASCTICDSALSGCLICNSSSKCLQCHIDYYLSGNNCNLCATITSCLKCNASAYCYQCQMGFYATGGSCTACSSTCLVCINSTFCSNCVMGYYSNSGVCTVCATNCLACNNTGYCLDCMQGFYESGGVCTNNCTNLCLICDNSTYCRSCMLGYFLNGTNLCQQCANGCVTCSSSTACISCSVGYYLHTNNTCQNCHLITTRCAKCTNISCLNCEIGFYVNGASCSSCSVMYGCIFCNSSTNCYTCSPGNYHTGGVGNNSCDSCPQGCHSCASNTNCTNCLPGFYLAGINCSPCLGACSSCNSNSVCLACELGYFLDGTICQQCSINITGCLDCVNLTHCITCAENHFLQTNFTCSFCVSPCVTCSSSNTSCLTCELGYFYAGSGVCTQCPINCSECVSAANCSSCIIGFYHNSTIDTCIHCSLLNCLTCNQTSCISCKTSYYINGNNCSSCFSAIQHCLDCSSNTVCLYCSYGYILNGNICSKCSDIVGCAHCNTTTDCVVCQNGYYLIGTTCSLCQSGCLTCNTTNCLTCAPSFIYNTTDCILCEKIIEGCQMCSSSSICTNCLNGYYLNINSCTFCRDAIAGCSYCNDSLTCVHCQDRFYLSGIICRQCSLIPGCQLCNSSTICLSCEYGFYLSGSNSCLQCHISRPGCISCSNSSVCLSCKSGFYLNGNICTLCKNSIPGCIFCSSATTCLQCSGGYYRNGSNYCISCSMPYCQVCLQTSPSSCVTCNSRYYLSGSSCLTCSSLVGCNQCNSSSVCTYCDTGYYLNGNLCNLCVLTLNGCAKCTNSSICIQCKSQYFLNITSQKCMLCQQALVGCAYCLSSTACLACSSSYFMNGTICQPCTDLTGCLMCSNITNCIYCESAYYLYSGDNQCHSCSVISFCYSCLDNSTCTACIAGYFIQNAGCKQVTVAPATIIKQLKLKSFYVDQDTLKHILYVVNSTFTKIDQNWQAGSKFTLVKDDASQVVLTIKSVQFSQTQDNALIFYTNNPLSLQLSSMNLTRLLVSHRNLLETPLPINYKVNFQMQQTIANQILPNIQIDSNLSLNYFLQDSQFYASYINTVNWGYYSLIGVVITILMIIIYFVKSVITLPNNMDKGQIIPHIIAIKCGALAFFPIYVQYISFCYGFMSIDFPWANSFFGSISDGSDYIPQPYAIFYTNLNIASMYVLGLTAIFIISILAFIIFKSFKKDKQYVNFRMYLYNIFILSIIIVGVASLQGCIFNPIQVININSLFYIVGLIILFVVLADCIYSVYENKIHLHKVRILIKGTLLGLMHFSPIYISAAVVIIDIALIIVLAYLLQKRYPKIWATTHILCNISLILIIYVPSALISIITATVLLVCALIMQLYMHIDEYSDQNPENRKKIFDKTAYTQNQKQTTNNIWNINFDGSQDKIQEDFQRTKYMFDKTEDKKPYQPIRKRKNRVKKQHQMNPYILNVRQHGQDLDNNDIFLVDDVMK